MQRRQFIKLLGSTAAAWPLLARGQQPLERIRRIVVVMNTTDANREAQSNVMAFMQALEHLGWNGQQIHIDIRWNAGATDGARAIAAELAQERPDVILASSSANLAAAMRVAGAAPVVFVEVADPVAQGFVASLAHPGGNITGFTAFETQTAGKWLDLLKQIAPQLRRIGVVFNPETSPPSLIYAQMVERAAPSLGVDAAAAPVSTLADVETVLMHFAADGGGGLIFTPDQFVEARRDSILELVARYRLPAIYTRRGFARAGALMTYSVSEVDQFRKAAAYVDRILRGEKPGDLPVQAPTKYELVINLKTAKALGLSVPPTMLAIADEVIE
jgi:putative ABC transport system substrate-binding protein